MKYLLSCLLLLSSCSITDRLENLQRLADRIPKYEQVVRLLIERYIADADLRQKLLDLLSDVTKAGS